MKLKCICGSVHDVPDPTFAPGFTCECETSLAHSPTLPRCPWCNTPQFVEAKGTWRCPNCTGYWTFTLGAPRRRYGMPAAPYVLWIALGFVAVGIFIIVAIVKA